MRDALFVYGRLVRASMRSQMQYRAAFLLQTFGQFLITGIARAEDVTADNSVLSTQMFDLRLEKNTKGAVRGATKRAMSSMCPCVSSPTQPSPSQMVRSMPNQSRKTRS